MNQKLFIIIVLLGAAMLLVFASCDNGGVSQQDRITLDVSPGDFDVADVDGNIPTNEEETMQALGDNMAPAMEGVVQGFESEFDEITCFAAFFEAFFQSFMPSDQGAFQPLAIVGDASLWDDINCKGTYKISGSETVNGFSGTASLVISKFDFTFDHDLTAPWLSGAIDIDTITMTMDDFVAESGDPIINGKGIVFTDVDVKVDFSNLNVEGEEPSGSIKVIYNAFDIQTEVLIAAANSSGYGGIFWLDFMVWIPPQTKTINIDEIMAIVSGSEPDAETIQAMIDAIAPGLSISLSISVYEGPMDDNPLEMDYDLVELIETGMGLF